MDCSPPGSSVHGVLQARILEWVAIPSSKGSSQTRDRTHISSVSWKVDSLSLKTVRQNEDHKKVEPLIQFLGSHELWASLNLSNNKASVGYLDS